MKPALPADLIISTIFEVANSQLKHVEAWLSANKLTLNTNNVAFRTPNNLPSPAALSI